MFKVLFILLYFFLLFYSCSDNVSFDNSYPPYKDINGNITEDFKLKDSPYRVLETIFIDSLLTISIEAGVKIYFTDSSLFIIKGNVLADGKLTEPILFSSLNQEWKGIKISRAHTNSVFRFAIFENIKVAENENSEFGAIEVDRSVVTFNRCIFRNNYSIQGGGLSLINSTANIYNNIFLNNKAVAFGGAILSYNSDTKIINNTFFRNYSFNHGGGLVLYNSKKDTVQNNIFYQNAGISGDPRISSFKSDSSNYYLAYNFLSVSLPDPRFNSEIDLDFRLSINSPCIDMGNPTEKYNDIDDSRNDQGAYGGPNGDW